jgi:phosphohistidine phosphatase
MRRLILFRHAKSDWSEVGRADHDRALSARGRRAAGPMGAWIAGRGFRPDLVLCSTAARARATWSLAKTAFSPQPPTSLREELYEAAVEAVADAVRSVPADVQTLLLVGHNPGFEGFVGWAAGSGDPEARRLLSVKFPTAAIAVLDLPGDCWSQLSKGEARLDRFVTPKALGLEAA